MGIWLETVCQQILSVKIAPGMTPIRADVVRPDTFAAVREIVCSDQRLRARPRRHPPRQTDDGPDRDPDQRLVAPLQDGGTRCSTRAA